MPRRRGVDCDEADMETAVIMINERIIERNIGSKEIPN
jgi:hypothetical protein